MKENKANKKGRKLLWGTVIITMILSFMFFYVLYCSNNKYMTREEKAIHGLLYADGSYESFPVYYLSREWEYYPDALLTPEDDLDKYYFRYIFLIKLSSHILFYFPKAISTDIPLSVLMIEEIYSNMLIYMKK